MRINTSTLLITAGSVALAFSHAHASSFTGSAYCGISQTYAATSPTLAQLPDAEATSGGLCATFSGSTVDFAAGGDGNSTDTLASFLFYGGASATFDDNGNGSTAIGSQGAEGTLLDITGNTYLTSGQSIELSHDDGALLYFNGALISPFSGNNQTYAGQSPFAYTGPTGSGNFELIYTSNYTPPQALTSDINTFSASTVTPEPGSLLLLGTGLFGVGGMLFRRASPASRRS